MYEILALYTFCCLGPWCNFILKHHAEGTTSVHYLVTENLDKASHVGVQLRARHQDGLSGAGQRVGQVTHGLALRGDRERAHRELHLLYQTEKQCNSGTLVQVFEDTDTRFWMSQCIHLFVHASVCYVSLCPQVYPSVFPCQRAYVPSYISTPPGLC